MEKKFKNWEKNKNKLKTIYPKIIKILQTAGLGSTFTNSYKKRVLSVFRLGFFKFPCFHILTDCEDYLLDGVYVMDKGVNINYETILWQFKCWKHCFQT